MKKTTPITKLIAATHSEEWLANIIENQDALNSYYLNYKFATLTLLDDDIENILGLVDVAILTNSYKWQKLYETLNLEYNPIWNYDGTNTITEVRGARDESHIMGARHNETTVGGAHVTTDERTAPFDSATVRDVGQTETNSEEHTDTYNANSYTDRDTAATYTDTITEVKGGNQGTTTTQKMITEERDVALFNYIDVVYKDIINLITYPYYS